MNAPLFQIGKLVFVLGVVLAVTGLLLLAASRMGFLGSLGRLPGDFAYKGRNFSFYFPIVTCLVLSVVLTLVLWLMTLFRRP